jgi:hypothetical protein
VKKRIMRINGKVQSLARCHLLPDRNTIVILQLRDFPAIPLHAYEFIKAKKSFTKFN